MLFSYVNFKKKMKITNLDRLNIVKRLARKDTIMPKPMITTDKKKKENKTACRGKVAFD